MEKFFWASNSRFGKLAPQLIFRFISSPPPPPAVCRFWVGLTHRTPYPFRPLHMIPCLEIVLQYSIAVRTVLARTQEGSFDTSVNIREKVYIPSRAGKLLRGVSKKRGKQKKVSLGGLFVIVKVVSAISIFASFFVRCLTSLKRGEIFFLGMSQQFAHAPNKERTHTR